MDLMPDDLRSRLLANGGATPGTDHVPVVKFFDPTGAATWLITEMMPDDPDILFGLCDLGMGCPELGSVRLSELQSVRGRFGLGIERDLQFMARYPLSVYARAAYGAGAITEAAALLAPAAAALAHRPAPDPTLPPPDQNPREGG